MIGTPNYQLKFPRTSETGYIRNVTESQDCSERHHRKTPPTEYLELHSFGDGGAYGFDACTYLRFPVEDEKNSYDSNLLQASSKVGPNKETMSTPRKELNGAVMAVKMIKELAKELGIPKEKCFVHIDSKVALWWISKPKEDLKVYVWNRVKVIQDADINLL